MCAEGLCPLEEPVLAPAEPEEVEMVALAPAAAGGEGGEGEGGDEEGGEAAGGKGSARKKLPSTPVAA